MRIGGKSWNANFAAILSHVSAGLGCGGWKVSAELYKLLVYDQGGFFVAHRDTEKAEGMFGTLVVVLPSAHRGGELIVGHAGREVTVDLAEAESSEVGFVAFYADCEHEVRPITAGHRVCLVYNLIQVPGHASKKA
ncbi:MAG: 2OG-Fe(II) oxygenase [Pedosphaera sp.]|nr:2OG-Fe(II) oxygenase [Pedosphaera sp.]